jgi:hypothetical protein
MARTADCAGMSKIAFLRVGRRGGASAMTAAPQRGRNNENALAGSPQSSRWSRRSGVESRQPPWLPLSVTKTSYCAGSGRGASGQDDVVAVLVEPGVEHARDGAAEADGIVGGEQAGHRLARQVGVADLDPVSL